MSRVALACDARRSVLRSLFSFGKCGKVLARSPRLGDAVQWSVDGAQNEGEVWLVDYNRQVACVYVFDTFGALNRQHSETIAWTALRPCNGEPLR